MPIFMSLQPQSLGGYNCYVGQKKGDLWHSDSLHGSATLDWLRYARITSARTIC